MGKSNSTVSYIMGKVTLITTVKNEEGSIEKFLKSIKGQVRKPDEVIIVDGGSADNTIEMLKNYELNIKNLRIIRRRGNRSVGRNTAIKAAANNIIAVTDAGCVLDAHWLERLVKPFEDKDIDVVAGFYKPLIYSTFERCLSTYTCTMADKLDSANFLPSSRSVAFRKRAWEKVKGYPQNLGTCEDLVFDKKLKQAGFRFVTQEKAFVWWPQRKNIFQAAKQFYTYAVGDGKAHYFRPTTSFLFARYFLGVAVLAYSLLAKNYFLLAILFVLFILYFLWAIWKNYSYIRKPSALFYLPALQLVSDVAVISGTIVGLFQYGV